MSGNKETLDLFWFEGQKKPGRKPTDPSGTGRKVNAYLRVDVLAALHEQSERLGRSLSWCLTEAARAGIPHLLSLAPVKDPE